MSDETWPQRMSRGLRVGITMHAVDDDIALWTCGATQNFVLFHAVLQQLPCVRELMFLLPGQVPCTVATPQYLGVTPRLAELDQALPHLDLLIELGASITYQQAQTVRSSGGKVVAYRLGPDYQVSVERAVFGLPGAAWSVGWNYDALWISPHYEHTGAAVMETAFRCPMRVVPHIWDSRFLDHSVSGLPSAQPFAYQVAASPDSAKRCAIFEPNIGVCKTAYVPLAICEQAYRREPARLKSVLITNATQLKEHPDFVSMVSRYDIVRQQIAWFEGRYPFGPFMAQHADVVVSHQWNNELNYLHYDALHGGYPLVHNSPPLRDLGYYYEDFDVRGGSVALLRACTEHDANLPAYRAAATAFLATLAPAYPRNVAAFSEALLALAHA